MQSPLAFRHLAHRFTASNIPFQGLHNSFSAVNFGPWPASVSLDHHPVPFGHL
jgi:hypothetical protein